LPGAMSRLALPRAGALGPRITADLAVVLVVWAALAALVWPVGDFPLNDDWSYGRSVEILIHEGRLDLVYAAVPLVSQVLWGALFTLPFGFSFEVLRVSTWLLGLFGLIATYFLLRSLRPPTWLALLGTLTLAVNPLYLPLSLTFMTDVPFVALSLISIAFLAYGLRDSGRWRLALGFLSMLLALLVRQPAIAIAIGFGVAYAATRPLKLRSILVATLPAVGCAVVLVGYELVLRRTVGLPPLYNHPFDPLRFVNGDVVSTAVMIIDRLGSQLLYVGILTLPLSLSSLNGLWRRAASPARLALVGGAGLVAAVWWLRTSGDIGPLGNVVYDLGVGPPLLRDTYVLGLPHLPTALPALWVIVGIAAAGGVVLLLACAAISRESARGRWTSYAEAEPALVIGATTAAVSMSFLVLTGFLDRYLLLLIPLGFVCIAPAVGELEEAGYATRAVTIIAILALAGFTILATHDYFAWNRARWAAVHHLVEDLQISAADVDAGYEFYGWHHQGPDSAEGPVRGWSRQRAAYVVAFGPIDGYREYLRFPFERWLLPGTGHIFVLQESATGGTN